MDRTTDAPYPTAVPLADACPTDLHVAVNVLVGLVGESAWDEALWDTDTWEAVDRWVDVAPDVMGVTVEHAEAEAAHLTLELRNETLRYSQAELEFPVGGLVAVWTDTDTADEWRFWGRISRLGRVVPDHARQGPAARPGDGPHRGVRLGVPAQPGHRRPDLPAGF